MHASHSRSFGIDNARVLTYALQHVTVSNSAHNKIHQADIISRYFRSAKQVSAWLVLDVCCLISTFFYVFYLFIFFFAFLPFQPLVSCTFVHLSLTINPLMDVLRYGDTPIRWRNKDNFEQRTLFTHRSKFRWIFFDWYRILIESKDNIAIVSANVGTNLYYSMHSRGSIF